VAIFIGLLALFINQLQTTVIFLSGCLLRRLDNRSAGNLYKKFISA